MDVTDGLTKVMNNNFEKYRNMVNEITFGGSRSPFIIFYFFSNYDIRDQRQISHKNRLSPVMSATIGPP